MINRGRHAKHFWNCGGNHGVDFCKKEMDQKQISGHKKKWEEENYKIILMVVVFLKVY